MTTPPLLKLGSQEEYRRHYVAKYCRQPVVAYDRIPVFFQEGRFEHAFFESTLRDGKKDSFSWVRAERMDWIGETLASPDASLFQGWNKKERSFMPERRVAVKHEEFAVVIRLKLNGSGELVAEFVTSYLADNSIERIKGNPVWNREACLLELRKRKGGR